ncbi:alcohol dehydrogenase catalytic domain-containing protein [Microbacterium lacticum]
MKAVVYEGPRQVSTKEVPDAKIERPTDVLIRVTTTNICGSDLHMYEGRTSFEVGRTFGHENMGEVIEVGIGVEKVRVGDRVVLPFNISCGFCKNCERGLTNYCLTTQPDPSLAGAADDSKVDPVQAVLDETMGLGADRGCECVGYQAHDPRGNEDNAATLNMLINSVRFTGGIGTVGMFVPQDPGAKDELAKQGKAAIDFGTHWFKGQTMGTGQAPVKRYNRQLRDLIAAGKATPSWIVSHEISLDQAADAYKNFDARSKGWTKVLIKPGMSNGKKEN